jgi:UDP-4-amino-4,6-dideoxy-N-acetyl-beta-L-altrosamine N-acetyltransferase
VADRWKGRRVLREATDEDRDVVRRWRNHPTVRKASFTTHEIGETEHARWWAKVAGDPSVRVLIYERDGIASGVVIFTDIDPVGRSAEWSFYLDADGVEARGDTLRAWFGIEKEAVAYAFVTMGLDRLEGETLAWNTPVRDLHRRSGFSEIDTYEREVDGQPHEVVRTAMTAASWKGRA